MGLINITMPFYQLISPTNMKQARIVPRLRSGSPLTQDDLPNTGFPCILPKEDDDDQYNSINCTQYHVVQQQTVAKYYPLPRNGLETTRSPQLWSSLEDVQEIQLSLMTVLIEHLGLRNDTSTCQLLLHTCKGDWTVGRAARKFS